MHSINNMDEGMIHTRPLIPDVPFHLGPTYRPSPKPIRSNVSRGQESTQISPSPENISSIQEGDISEAYQRPDKSFLFKNCKYKIIIIIIIFIIIIIINHIYIVPLQNTSFYIKDCKP